MPEALDVGDWFAEPPFAGYQQRYRVKARLHSERTDWQTLELVDLELTGRTLLLDGTLQTSVGEEFTYHEPLVHIPLFAHPSPHRVLIVGGGDGGALRHVLLHAGVELAVQVEIDRRVMETSVEFLPEISRGALQDPRARIVVDDGAHYLAATIERFDVILVDSTDPVGPAEALLSSEFLKSAHRALAPGGLMAMQSGSPLTQPRESLATVSAFRREFPLVRSYLGFVPIYPGVLWSWVAGSDEIDPSRFDEVTASERLNALPEALRIYNTALHRASFALPTFLRRMYDHEGPLDQSTLRTYGHPLPGVVGT